LLRGSIAMLALVFISLFVSRSHGVARVDWLRDVAPYLLFALAPLFAFDAQSAFSRKALVRLLVSAGLIAAAAFATYWVEQRHIANLPFARFALASFLFPAALVAYAIATALQARRHRGRWVFLAVLGFALLIATGTRSTLIVALAPIVAVFAARRERAARLGRLALVGPVALVLMLAAAYGVLTVTHASHTVIGNRLTILKHSGSSSDASYADRQAQAHVAGRVFSAHPVFGAGPGTYFNWKMTNGEQRSAFNIDTPVDFPAKYGVVGLGMVAFLLLAYGSFLKSAFRISHPRPETLALAAYLGVALANALLANPFEDKGWTLGLILLLALVLRTSGGSAPARVESPLGRTAVDGAR
jgi:O-antigen ligase